jgi:hypothetical protein
MNKKGQLEILESTAFWILLGVGYGAFAIMLFVLKGMGQASIMPLWVKIVAALIIPVIAGVWAMMYE